MATLSVLKFPTPDGAEQMLGRLAELQKAHVITLQDAAIVTWPVGSRAPKTRQVASLTAAGALDGAFWGFLFGLIFFVPLFGLALGAAVGALAGHFATYGISDDFIKQSRDAITEGTSGLFLLTQDATTDKLAEALKDVDFSLVTSSLSLEDEQRLRDTFAAARESRDEPAAGAAPAQA